MSHLLSKKSAYYFSWSHITRHLVTDPKYGFLKQLGITFENPGLYDGNWSGSGKVHNSGYLIGIKIFLCEETERSVEETKSQKTKIQIKY